MAGNEGNFTNLTKWVKPDEEVMKAYREFCEKLPPDTPELEVDFKVLVIGSLMGVIRSQGLPHQIVEGETNGHCPHTTKTRGSGESKIEMDQAHRKLI